MNAKQVQKFVVAYLEKTGCQLIEKSPARITVKLSPEADRALTNRPYYWSFVDRTGVPPETLTFTWHFGPPQPAGTPPAGTPAAGSVAAGPRILQEQVYYGSGRLNQLFDCVRQGGRCVMMFEEPPRADGQRDPFGSRPYTAWLGVNFKVSRECDMKRDELYGWGVSLATGVIDERFRERLAAVRLTPRLPANVHLLKNGLSLRKAMNVLETALERKLKGGDFAWAEEAEARRLDERSRIEAYYRPMIERADDAAQAEALRSRCAQREAESDWQYRPRVTISVINCGVFHLPGIH